MVAGCEAGRPVGTAEERRAKEAVALPLAAARARFCREVEAGAPSSGRRQGEERARDVRSPVWSRAGRRC